MPLNNYTLDFDLDFNDNSYGAKGLVISVEELKQFHLWGIPFCNPVTGVSFSDTAIRNKIQAAQQYVENVLGIKLFKQYVRENKDFVREEYQNWAYFKATWLVNKPFRLRGKLNERNVLVYPNSWLTIRRKHPADYDSWRTVQIVPNGQDGTVTFDQLAMINNQWFNFYGSRIIPFYWNFEYLTGFDVIPTDIINLIGKWATVQVLPVIEMAVTGGGTYAYGAASQSLSMDGLSQSMSKANGGNVFKERIRQYTEEVKNELESLKLTYGGLMFDVC